MKTKSHPALELILDDERYQTFYVARGRAIEGYANFEHELFMLFSSLLGTSADYAGVAFFRINNANARSAMMDRLLAKRCGATYDVFWNSLADHLRKLDATRNQIVHWATAMNVTNTKTGKFRYHLTLVPPNFWDTTAKSSRITLHQMYDFIAKCQFVQSMVRMFHATLTNNIVKLYAGDLAKEMLPRWQVVFQGPVVYPPPEGHPLFREVTDSP